MTTTPTRVLVVDDEPVIRRNLIAFLEDEGFQAICVDTGKAALDYLAEKTAEVGLVDVRLPDMDVNSVILKAHRLHPRMKFLIYTGSPAYDLPGELRQIGITEEDVLHKPLTDMERIVEAIRRLTARKTVAKATRSTGRP